MKKRWFNLVLAGALATALTLPAAQAWERHDLIFDQTEALYTDTISELSSQLLPDFTEQYGVELQVDVMMTLGDYDSVAELAQGYYESYGYGYGDGHNGVSLTLLVHEDEDGLALDDWYVYAGGDSWELTDNGPANAVNGVEDWLDGWYGDLYDDQHSFEQAVFGLMDSMESFILSGGVASTIYDPNGGSYEDGGGTEAAAAEADLSDARFVYDTAGLLTEDQAAELEAMGMSAAERYGCGLYIVTVEDFQALNLGSTIDEAGDNLFGELDLGVGSEDSGCLLLLSMYDRDYVLVADGYGNTAFTDYGKEELAEAFLDDFGGDDWYSGFVDYMNRADEMIAMALDGEAVDVGSGGGGNRGLGIAVCVILGLIIAFIVKLVLHGQMKSVAAAGEARYYVNKAGTSMGVVQDLYTHTTQSRVYDPPQKSSSGGTSVGSSGRSTSSGKF